MLLTRLLGADRALRGLRGAQPAARLRSAAAAAVEPEQAWLLEELPRAVERWSPRAQPERGEALLRAAVRLGVRLLTPLDAAWPRRVEDLGEHAPLALWCRGDLSLLDDRAPTVAIVGARAASGYGEHLAIELAAGLAERGVRVVSGGAYGIDGAAHRSALASGGATLAVMAGGPDRLYPRGNLELLHRIVREGLLLSELPCGQSPTRWRFLQRNRIIAALASATVVVEAGERSGALNTAAHAAGIARPLGAVPGPVTSPGSAGCHRLLRDFDAVCVRDAEDALELAGGLTVPVGGEAEEERGRQEPAPGPDGVGTRVWNALGSRTERSPEQLALAAGVSCADARGALAALELEGFARRGPAGWRRSRPA
ncbi:MAG: DNA-processing protein DprA [Pseudoclavibacter sp.]|nr:DNA-processing protein DprA [Pseudoclavibacter sp.]